MDDIVIDKDQFKVCMVKKTKHYYKQLGLWGGFLTLMLLLCIGLVYVIDVFDNLDFIIGVFIVFTIYMSFMCGITYAVTNRESSNYSVMFIRNFIALHGVIIVFVLSIAIMMICLSAIPVEMAVILGQAIFNITDNFGMAFIGAIIVFCLTVPINISVYQCCKVEEYMNECFMTSITWLNIKD